MRRYVSADEDSARWQGLSLREGDVVVSTRTKHGTTWLQTILLLLIHQQPELPAPLGHLSPWLDHLVEPLEAVATRLAAQRHRRVIKTHTPLDGVPIDPRVTYVVGARHPLDAAVAMYHQGDNLDRELMHQLIGTPPPPTSASRPPLEEWLRAWVERDADPVHALDSLPGVLWHLSDAWSRRDQGNVVLVHFDDLLDDLSGQMRRLADHLDLHPPRHGWEDLVEAATFEKMRARAADLVPDPVGILRDPNAFFRRGRSGAGTELLDSATLARYEERTTALAPTDLLSWLHR